MNQGQLRAVQAPLKEKYRLRFELDTDAPDEKLDRLIETTERYGVVLQTLRQSIDVRSTTVRLVPAQSE
jgi:uncharacterized OsmC-like protein